MKFKDWNTIVEKLKEQGATEETDIKFFSEAGVPYEIKKDKIGCFSIKKDEKLDLFKIWIK